MTLKSYAEERDFNVMITAQGSIDHQREFQSIGSGKIYSAETLLQPHGGFDTLYENFLKEPDYRITTGVVQKAEAFHAYLQRCNISVPAETLIMRFGHDAIFAAKSQSEINLIAEEVGRNLSFEKKITFISQVGGSLSGIYDNDRDPKGIVSMMDMVQARQNGTNAGVCRDMHQAMAQLMVSMGVPDTFVVATQVVGGGHAVLLAQDPNDASKTYMVNYNFTTSQRSGSSSAHLMLNSTIPSIGHSYRIYSASGKPLTTLPSGLGTLLNDFIGKSASDLDPYARSASSFVRAEIASRTIDNRTLSASVATGSSPDGDQVTAISGRYKIDDEHFPAEFNFSLYNLKRETNLRGTITGNGAYLDGVQHVRYTPVRNANVAGGKADVVVYGRIGMRSNFTLASEEASSKKNEFSGGVDVYAATGTSATLRSSDGRTALKTNIEALGALDKADVRNEDKSAMTFDLRHITGSVALSRELARGTSGYRLNAEARGSITARPGLGVQSRQELEINLLDKKGRIAALTVSREGQVQGRTLAFVPGSLETYAVEASYTDRNRNGISGGIFCTTNNGLRSCGTRATGRIRF